MKAQLAAQHRFVTNAAHQLRTPLAMLNLQATCALRRIGAADQAAALRAIGVGVGEISRLAKQLLTLSRAEPGSRRARAHCVSFGALARRVVDGVAARALENDIDLGLDERDPASATVKVETMMGEMLLNLVDNALRYCSVGCSVTVVIEMEGQEAVLTVQDDGPGLPPVEEERVFERFYCVEGTAPSARGLGLSIVKEMAEAAGGRVAALRSASGGLRVVVRLPAAVDGLAGPALG